MRRNQHIEDYSANKVADFLQPGQKNLVMFGHGWGDTLMFDVVYAAMKKKWPHVHWHIYVETGQEKIIKSSPKDGDYDFIFHLHYPMGEGSGHTKNAWCCMQEIGMEPVEGVGELPKYKSPLVAVHFQGTALPDSVNCPEDKAKIIWDDIISVGLVPIEVHFEHIYHNPKNSKYNFINSTVRGTLPRLPALIGIIQRCYAFIGSASGPFVTALSVMPEKTLLLERAHKLRDYVPDGIGHSLKVENIQPGVVKNWLKSLHTKK